MKYRQIQAECPFPCLGFIKCPVLRNHRVVLCDCLVDWLVGLVLLFARVIIIEPSEITLKYAVWGIRKAEKASLLEGLKTEYLVSSDQPITQKMLKNVPFKTY